MASHAKSPWRASCAKAALLLLWLAAAAACHHDSPTAPSPPTTPHANITITSLSVGGERASATGYQYRVVLHLRESAGAAATIVSVDLTFMNGSTTVVSSHSDKPISDSANVCPPNGAVETREFVVVDADPSHAYATTVEAKVTFTDTSSVAGAASATANVPPLSTPPPPQTFALTGVITDASTHVGIGGARVEALTGVNAGKATTTDSAGTYVLTGLLAETFRMRASADGYQWGEQNVTVPDISRADLELRRTLQQTCGYTLSPPSVAVDDGPYGGSFTATRVGSTTCSWTATTSDRWIIFSGPTSGNDSATVGFYLSSGNDSTEVRTGTVVFTWEGGQATVTVVQNGVTCGPSFTRTVPSSSFTGFVGVGAACFWLDILPLSAWCRPCTP